MAETRRKPIGSPGRTGFRRIFCRIHTPKLQPAAFALGGEVNYRTPDKDEKAASLAAVFRRMGELLGPLHHESYAHVDEVKGASYGFGGLTQERRYIARQLEAVRQQEAAWSIAFSSEVDTRARSCDAGSREENASK